jgi:TldD protein
MRDKKEAASHLSSSGFSIWDIYEESSAVTAVTYEDNRVEKYSSGVDYGIGVRGVKGQKTSYGYTNDPSNIKKIVSGIASGMPGKELSFMEPKPQNKNIIRLEPENVLPEKKAELLRAMNDAARSFSGHISQVTVNYSEKVQDIEILNDRLEYIKERRVYTGCTIMAVARREGRIETGYSVVTGHAGFEIFDGGIAVKKAVEAAGLAVRLLDADRKLAGEMTAVISSSAGGTMIHEAVGHSLEADLVQKGLSQYGGKKGVKVASDIITVIDDATIPNRRGSFSFDDEGTPAQKTVLIDKGVLVNYMYDRETAARDNAKPTGNGRRESYKFRPIPRMRNTMIAPGAGSAESLIKDTKRGIFVVRMGGGQVNTVTGEFVFEVKEGYMIEDGKVTDPVRGATLMGTGVEVLNSIDAVCSDIGFDAGTCGKDGQGVPVGDAQPTLRIPRILVGSK